MPATDYQGFQRHVAVTVAELRNGEEFLSLDRVDPAPPRGVPEEEFRVVVAKARRRGGGVAQAEKLVAEYHERAMKALDVCNAARDGVDQVRR
jgi:hypothetical protein